jgi:hypothetical protein
LVDGDGVGDGVEAIVAQVGPDQARVLLFDEAIVVPFDKLRTSLW